MRLKLASFALAASIAASTAASAAAANPVATGSASPSTVAPGRSTLLTVAVSPGTAPPSTSLMVTCNLSSLGGDFIQLLVDDGTNGDLQAGDLVFSFRAVLAQTTSIGPRTLPCVASDAEGRVATTSIVLNVDASANHAPTASAGGPYSGTEGSPVWLTALGDDPENDPLSFAWDLDDDGSFETPGQAAALLVDDGPATRWVRVRATDGLLYGVDRVAVNVANVAPTASLRVPSNAQPGSPFAVALESAADASAADSVNGFEYSFDCGGGYGAYSSAPSANCSAADGRSVDVGGRIRDKDGGVREYRGAVTIAVSATGDLCRLTRSLSRRRHVADRLCRKLHQAERARNARKRRAYLRAYRLQVRAQTGMRRGKAFRPADGGLLQRLALALERR